MLKQNNFTLYIYSILHMPRHHDGVDHMYIMMCWRNICYNTTYMGKPLSAFGATQLVLQIS